MTLEQMINGGAQTTKARLLHYFPPQKPDTAATDDSWCGTHLDSAWGKADRSERSNLLVLRPTDSMLTGLCSAIYLRHDGGSTPTEVPPPASDAGLYIHTRGGDVKKVSIPPNALAFQTGEALELCTAGRLRATPHLVKAGSWTPEASSVSRGMCCCSYPGVIMTSLQRNIRLVHATGRYLRPDGDRDLRGVF